MKNTLLRLVRFSFILFWLSPFSLMAKEMILESNIPHSDYHATDELPAHDENLMGEAIMQKIQGTNAVIVDPIVNEYLSQMAKKFNAHINNIDFKLHFFGIETPELNAFAFFGGHVAVHSGLITAVDRESELAAVLAHETSHISQHHLARILASNKKMMPLTIAELLAAATVGALGAPEAGIHLAKAALAGHVQQLINYTRDHEQEADRLGIALLSKTGFDPNGMPAVFQKLSQKMYYHDKPPEYLLTHPMFDSRIADAQNRIEKLDYKKPSIDSLLFHFVRARLEVAKEEKLNHKLNRLKDHLSKANDNNKVALEYGYALALLKKQQFNEAYKIMKKLTEQYPNDWVLSVGLAEVEFASGNVDLALKRLNYLLELHPDNQAIAFFNIQGLLALKRPTEALTLLKKYQQYHMQDPIMFQMYARAFSMIKNPLSLHRSQAEWHYLRAEYKEAFAQLDIGLEYAENQPKIAQQLRERKEIMKKIEKFQKSL